MKRFLCALWLFCALNIESEEKNLQKLVVGDTHNASMHHKNAIKMSYQKHKSYYMHYIHIIKAFFFS